VIFMPREEMGRIAADKLIGRILHVSDRDVTPVIRHSTFIARESIGPAPTAPMAPSRSA